MQGGEQAREEGVLEVAVGDADVPRSDRCGERVGDVVETSPGPIVVVNGWATSSRAPALKS